MDLTDEQWDAIKRFIPGPERKRTSAKGGRPWLDPRDVNGVIWILRTGAPWADLPARYPPYQTCHRRFLKWVRDGVLEKALRALAEDLLERGGLDLTEAYVDGSHAGAKKGGLRNAFPPHQSCMWFRPGGSGQRPESYDHFAGLRRRPRQGSGFREHGPRNRLP